ncbi:KRFB protein, partial [Eudromia elegans]|nr:KRFB protein [Eudromia elegans]
VTCPEPCASAWNEPCVTSCGDSRAVVYPPPVIVTFPGPIISSCPQQSMVGTVLPNDGNFLGRSYGGGSSMGIGGSYGG